MSNAVKRGLLCAACVAAGLCTVAFALAAAERTQTAAAGNATTACTARSSDQPSVGKAPATDDVAARRRRWRRRGIA